MRWKVNLLWSIWKIGQLRINHAKIAGESGEKLYCENEIKTHPYYIISLKMHSFFCFRINDLFHFFINNAQIYHIILNSKFLPKVGDIINFSRTKISIQSQFERHFGIIKHKRSLNLWSKSLNNRTNSRFNFESEW